MGNVASGRPGNTTSTDELYQFLLKGGYDPKDTGLDLDTFPDQSFVFEVRAAYDAWIVLCQERDNYAANKIYQFVISGWSNTQTTIRKGDGVELVKAATFGLLNEFCFRTFWVSWKNGQVSLGQGSAVGQKIVVQYTDSQYFRPRYLSVSSSSVLVNMIIHRPAAAPSDLMQITVPNYTQTIDTGIRLDLSTRKYLLFEAKCANDVWIMLTQYKDVGNANTCYNMIIGGWSNTRSALRLELGGTEVQGVATPNILSDAEFRPFWISWVGGKIRLGKGSVVGEQVIIDYTDPKPIPVFHLAISGYSAKGTVRLHREPLILDGKIKDGVSDTTYRDTGLYLSQSKQKSLLFQANGAHDIYFVLSQHKEYLMANKCYEVIVGGWGNTKSTLRKTKYDEQPVLAEVSGPMLDATKLLPFWMSWADGYIRFGRGSVVGTDVILEYKDTTPIPVNWLSLRGWDVPVNALIKPEPISSDIVQFAVPPRYEYWDVEGFDLSHRKSLVIDLLATQHIFVALVTYRFTYEADRMYSFMIGSDCNTRSHLRKNRHGVGPELVAAATPKILDDTKFVSYWLSWGDGVLKLGRGKVVGVDGILEYRDPLPIPVNYLAFAGWDAPGTALIYSGVGDGSAAQITPEVSGSVIKMSDSYAYADSGMDLSACSSFVFYLKGSTDASLALTSTKDNYDGKIYEIVFGAFANTCTVIRIKKNDDMVDSTSTPNILDANNFRPFWISWAAGDVRVGKGTTVGERIVAVYYDEFNPIAVRYLGITGNGAPCAISIS